MNRDALTWALSCCLAMSVGMSPVGAGQHGAHGAHGQAGAVEAPPEPEIIWTVPQGVRFQLDGLSNEEFVRVKRSAGDAKYLPFFEAALVRPGIPTGVRVEALKALSKLKGATPAALLAGGVDELGTALAGVDASDEAAAAPLRKSLAELGAMLYRLKPQELKEAGEALGTLATSHQAAEARRVAYAGLLVAGADVDKLWEEASTGVNGVSDLVGAVALLPDPKARAAFAPRVMPLLDDASDAVRLRAAIEAATAMPGHEAAVFASLTKVVDGDVERPAAVAGLLRLDAKHGEAADALKLAKRLLELTSAAPVEERTTEGFLDMVSLGQRLSARLPDAEAGPIRAELGKLGVRIITLKTVHEEMRYDVNWLAVEAGKPVQIILENKDTMPHNLVVVAPGAREEIGQTAERMPPEPDGKGLLYVPQSEKVLAAMKLVGIGETAKLTFIAPEQEGEYVFVCTFPGHWMKMFGTLVVYRGEAPQPPAADDSLLPYTLEDLRASLPLVNSGRDLAAGKQWFKDLGCVQCHRAGGLGEAFGPDMKDAVARWKHEPEAVLKQLLAPSEAVAPGYEVAQIETSDFEVIRAVVLKETADSLLVQAGPGAQMRRTLSKADIEKRDKVAGSLMPVLLTRKMKPEQVMDLLAFLLAEK